MDLQRKAVREAREKELAEQKEKMQVGIAKVQEATKAAEPHVTEALKQSQKLPAEAKALRSPAMLARADDVQALIQAGTEQLGAAKELASGFGAGEEVDKDLVKWVAAEKQKLNAGAAALESQLGRAAAALDRFRADASKKDAAEVKELAAKALRLLKAHQAEKGLSAVALFDAIDTKRTGSFGSSEFVVFVKGLATAAEEADAMTEVDLTRAFAHFDAILLVLMKVVKDVAITQGR